MSYVFHRGEFVNENQATITKDNRAFRYGDGFFESLRVVNGHTVFFGNHFSRIRDSLQALKIRPGENFSEELLASQIQGLIKRNNLNAGGRIRITFFRKSLGFYLPDHDDLGYFIESEPMQDNEFVLNTHGKTVDLYSEFKKDVSRLSMFKTINAQLYVMGSLYAREKGLDDVLLQNNKMAIIESTASNLFIVSNGVLYTPALQDGCVAGTMRMNIINIALENKIKVYECTLSPHNFLSADELFFTNAVRGVEWVVAYKTKRYYNDMSRRMVGMLNELAAQEPKPVS